MNRARIRLVTLFSHWRDQPLLEMEAAIGHLANRNQLSAQQLRQEKAVVTTFELDERGRPQAIRRDMALPGLLQRHLGVKAQGPINVTPILGAFRLERERRLRQQLYRARESVGDLLQPMELRRLKSLPMLASPAGAVARLLRQASARTDLDIENHPATALARALPTRAAQAVLNELHVCLGWTGPARGPRVQLQDLALLTLVLPWALDPDADARGFDFYASAHSGAAISDLLAAMGRHLIPRLPGCPPRCLGLVRYLLADSTPPVLNLLGLPPDLAWTSSFTWISLCQGVNLAEAIAPGSSGLLSVSEALALPAQINERSPSAPTSQALVAALASPLAQWNIAWQRIARLQTRQSLARALDRYLNHFDALERARAALSRPMPQKRAMVSAELEARGIAPDMRFVEPRDRMRQSLLAHGGVSAQAAFASGLAAWPEPALVPALVRGHDGRLHEPACNAVDIPNLATGFEQAFDQWKQGIAVATNTLTQRLLADLPVSDQLRLDEHRVTLCQLAQRTSSGDTLIAPYGFVLHVVAPQGTWYYELIPSAGWCRLHANVQPPLPLPGHIEEIGSLPFDASAFSTGGLPGVGSHCHGWLTPVVSIPPSHDPGLRLFRNNRLIAHHCAKTIAAHLETLRSGARADEEGEATIGLPAELKTLVPFWSATETIRQGLDEKRSWLVVLGLFNLAADALTLGTYGRLSALGLRFVTLALRQGPRAAAVRALTPRLRSAGRDAFDTLLFSALTEEPATSGVSLMVPLRRAHGGTLRRLVRQLSGLSPTPRVLSDSSLGPFSQPTVYLKRLADDIPVTATAEGFEAGRLIAPRLVDHQTLLTYGPILDVIDDTGRLGRLPLELPVITLDARHYIPDPAPSLPKRWIGWGEETWLECSGRHYRLHTGMDSRPVRFEQAEPPFARPELEHPRCRARRVLPPLACAAPRERRTQGYTELTASHEIAGGAVDWFDQRKIIPDGEGRFVDQRRLMQGGPDADRVVERLGWARYQDQLRARIVTGNALFKRIEVLDGLVADVADRRLLSAVELQAQDGQRHLVTCVDDGIYYHGLVSAGDDTIVLNKLSEQATLEQEDMSLEQELKYLFNGCWDANWHIRQRGSAVVEQQLRQIEAAMAAGGIEVEQLMTRRFRLQTTPAQAALFATYPRRGFVQQTRRFVASDYTHPLTAQTSLAVRERIATHLSWLADTPGILNAETVLEHSAVDGLAPKGKNIAFLFVTYRDGRPEEVYYSASGAASQRRDLPLARRLRERMAAGASDDRTWIAEDGTRYINCRGEGGQPGEEALLHLPDLSRPDNLNSGDINDRRLDSERNIFAYLERRPLPIGEIAEANLFTRFPTCDSCTSLINQYRDRFPEGRFQVYEGPRPAASAGEASGGGT
ncbi:deaminase domain-containing protein [Pseudomonas sp. DC3000-4b1]|uniref:deaminase domain-containing protein n=1 Tax=unclassified Pseudomonas TaxID=196821 RepID=UPI003CF28F28